MALTRSGPVLGGLAVAVLAVAGCGSAAGGDPAADGEGITVVASTNVWGSVARAVGGDAVTVESLINDSAGDPHAHPDRPSDAAALARADLALYNGGGYDEFFTKLLDATGVELVEVNAFELSAHAGEQSHTDEESHTVEHGHDHGAVNEHVWYDLATVGTVAGELAERFGELAPDEAAGFTANADAFVERLDDLTTRAEAIGAARPGAKVLATEPVADYLLETAGLTDATPAEFSEAIEEETDPPLSVVAQTTDLLTDRQVVALVNNAQTETGVTGSLRAAAEQAGIPVVDVTETLPQGVTDYVEWMSKQVDALSGALST